MRRRGGTRAVEGKCVMGPWEDTKRNKKEAHRRMRQLERAALRKAA